MESADFGPDDSSKPVAYETMTPQQRAEAVNRIVEMLPALATIGTVGVKMYHEPVSEAAPGNSSAHRAA